MPFINVSVGSRCRP